MTLLPAHRTPGSPARGQAMVEFALVLPILALLLVMAIDFGRVFFGWVALHNASRIAADFAASHTDNWTTSEDTYRALVRGDLESINCFPPGESTWEVGAIPDPDYPSGTAVGSPAVVALQCSFDLITPLAGSILGGSVTVGAESTFPIHKAIQQPLPPDTQPDPPDPDASEDPGPGPDPDDCEAPTASFSTNPAPSQGGRVNGDSPLSVTFTDTSTSAATCPITTWSWSFGNGSSSLQNPTQVFTHSGNGNTSYSVVLTVINSEGSDTASITVRVTD